MQKKQITIFFTIGNNHAQYLRQMMLIRILFYFIVFYSLFKFLIRFVLPLVITTRNVRAKMKDMRQNMEEFQNNNPTANPGSEAFAKKEAAPASKGDYIDFEEI
ncbi:MAG: hypothetical protein JWQ09_625 [Segetibacter sp.]|nr:hypothetical protein [Segetibacter sp.]